MVAVKIVVARKDYPEFGIKRGARHYTWAVPLGGTFKKYRSMTAPKKSQLVPPGYQQDLAVLREAVEALDSITDTEQITGLMEQITQLQEDTQEKFDNMPEPLQRGATGQLLEERVAELQGWLDELDVIKTDSEAITDDMEDCAEQWEEVTDRVHACTP